MNGVRSNFPVGGHGETVDVDVLGLDERGDDDGGHAVLTPVAQLLDKGEMVFGTVDDAVNAVVRPAVGPLVNGGFLREGDAIHLALLGGHDGSFRVGEGRDTGTEPCFLGDDLFEVQVGFVDGHGRNEQRTGGEKDFRPVDLAGVLLVGFFLRVNGGIRMNLRGCQHALAFLVDARETIGPLGAVRVTGKGHVEYRVQVPYLGVKGREARRVDFLLLVQGRLLAVLGAAADLAVA
ncbi:hypothetical protein DWX82_05875 [Odoribacter sp. AF21-41]|nr:hypothetical protein DWX82_05875 [Odoribacter sp. AF21-41]RHH97717.1 hypothetical protein DW186_00240 [Odoribacter sp. AM16-33]